MDFKEQINTHYGTDGLSEKILKALEDTGKDISFLSMDDLAPMEEFHIGGRKATYHLANLAGLFREMTVLDIGCGIGGPARTLAYSFGCNVVGIDLSKEFCLAGAMLTKRADLSDKIKIINGIASNLPFRKDTFDVVWMQHSAVNIFDKESLFQEIRSILRPGGKLALYELFKSSLLVKHFPLPWAKTPEMSFLKSESDVQNLLKSNGYKKIIWEDATKTILESFRYALNKTSKQGYSPVSLLTVMGPDFPRMAQNVLKNLEEHRLKVIFAVYSLTADNLTC